MNVLVVKLIAKHDEAPQEIKLIISINFLAYRQVARLTAIKLTELV